MGGFQDLDLLPPPFYVVIHERKGSVDSTVQQYRSTEYGGGLFGGMIHTRRLHPILIYYGDAAVCLCVVGMYPSMYVTGTLRGCCKRLCGGGIISHDVYLTRY